MSIQQSYSVKMKEVCEKITSSTNLDKREKLVKLFIDINNECIAELRKLNDTSVSLVNNENQD